MSNEQKEPEMICAVRGLLFGGRAVCGKVGARVDGGAHKCWSEEPCEHQAQQGKAVGDE